MDDLTDTDEEFSVEDTVSLSDGATKGVITDIPADPAGTARVRVTEGPGTGSTIRTPLALLRSGGPETRDESRPTPRRRGGK